MLPRYASFSFSLDELSLPVERFIVTINRVTGHNQRFCTAYADYRPIYIPGNESNKVFTQDFFNMEENSSYVATFTAEFNTLRIRVNRTTSINFDTPGDGKKQ